MMSDNKEGMFMKVEYYKEFSHELNRDMEFKVFGHAGVPCLVFPAQDGRFYDFENFGVRSCRTWRYKINPEVREIPKKCNKYKGLRYF